MRSSIRLSTWLCLLSFALVPMSEMVGAEYAPKVGELHPDFTLPNISSVGADLPEAVSLSQYRGSKVLLIHFASW